MRPPSNDGGADFDPTALPGLAVPFNPPRPQVAAPRRRTGPASRSLRFGRPWPATRDPGFDRVYDQRQLVKNQSGRALARDEGSGEGRILAAHPAAEVDPRLVGAAAPAAVARPSAVRSAEMD